MKENHREIISGKCSSKSLEKLEMLANDHLDEFIAYFTELCDPESVYICDDSDEDRAYIRRRAVERKEEHPLDLEGHTVHFDSMYDQARDKANTKYLIDPDVDLGPELNCVDKAQGIEEVTTYYNGIMDGKEMYVLFFCLGPVDSEFAIPCVQITDSSYVAHSEYILYRTGYSEFRKLSGSDRFFRYIHSAGRLENGVSADIDKRRIYIDLDDEIVYSVNTQYAGNTVGLKKLSLRLAICKADREGWLAEHMLLMGVHGPDERKTYFAGAFPSACGKTSTAMIPGETIVGDDIAYLRKRNGNIYGANVECGIFGIIRDVHPDNDPVIWDVLTHPGEVIFSNVLITDNKPYWLGDGRNVPEQGVNFSGEWEKGLKDEHGQEIPHSHKNARYTINLNSLENADPMLDSPEGVEVKGIIYGGRDSSIWPPVQQSFNWNHGVVTMAASLESETTAATLGREGVRVFNPMSNIDFLAIPLGRYIENHLAFGSMGSEDSDEIKNPALIFGVNYFRKDDDGQYLTGMEDKRVWMKWMELRVHGDAQAVEIPTGYIPVFEDLKRLFREVLDKEYSEADYNEQFCIKIPENIEKIERIEEIYQPHADSTPEAVFAILQKQKERLLQAQRNTDHACPSPGAFISV